MIQGAAESPICPKCRARRCEWRKDRQKYRPTCKLCRQPDSTVRSRLRRAGRVVKELVLENYTALSRQKEMCEQCGFVAAHPCQLDIDHIDGNSTNDSS